MYPVFTAVRLRYIGVRAREPHFCRQRKGAYSINKDTLFRVEVRYSL